MSVAQSFGICVPASIAARMIEVPSGTVTLLPSMVSVTIVSDLERGVPKSISWISDMAISFIPRPADGPVPGENLPGNVSVRS